MALGGGGDLNVRLTAQNDASKEIRKVADELAKLEDHTAEISVSMSRSDVLDQIQKVQTTLRDLAGQTTEVAVTARVDAADQLSKLGDQLRLLDAQDVDFLVQVHDKATDEIDGINRAIRDLEGSDVSVLLEARDNLTDVVRSARSQLDTLANQEVNIRANTSGLDQVTRSGGQARSVLANMVGNSAQDLGALAGAGGTAGVALGQMAEYAADGNISLAGLAKVAGPMAAVGVAALVVGGAMKSIAATDAFKKEQVEDFAAALEDAKVSATELREVMASGDDEGLFVRLGGETKDAEDSIQRVMGTFQEFQAAVDGGVTAYDAFTSAQLTSAAAGGASQSQIEALSEVFANLREGQTGLGNAFVETRGKFDDQIYTAAALAQGINFLGIATTEGEADAAFYGETLEGVTEKQRELDAATSRTTGSNALWEVQQKKNAEQAEREAEATDRATEAREAYAEAARESARITENLNTALASTEWKSASLDGAITAMSQFNSQLFGLDTIAANAHGTMESFADQLRDNGGSFDLATEAGRENHAGLVQLASTMDGQFAAAYANAGGNMDTFKASAQGIRADMVELAIHAGLSAEKANELADQLGLTEGDYEARFKLSGIEEAKARLALLNGDFSALSESLQNEINYRIATGDAEGALMLVVAGYEALTTAAEGTPDAVEIPTEAPGADQAAINLWEVTRAGEAVPFGVAVPTTAPGATQATGELQGTKGAADQLPPSKTVIVGAPGATDATGQVGDLRGEINDLSGKTVSVSANTSGLQSVKDLKGAIDSVQSKTVTITSRVNTAVADGAVFAGRVRTFAQGGIDRAREIARPAQARLQRGLAVMFGEPETEGESYIPWARSKRRRSTGLLAQTAQAFGYGLVKMAEGGAINGNGAAAAPVSVGSPVVNLSVTLDGRELRHEMRQVAIHELGERDARVRAGRRH